MYKKLLSLLFVCASVFAMEDDCRAYVNSMTLFGNKFCIDGQILPVPEEDEMDPFTSDSLEFDRCFYEDTPAILCLKQKPDMSGGIRKYRRSSGIRKTKCSVRFYDVCEFRIRCPACHYKRNVVGTREKFGSCISKLEKHIVEQHLAHVLSKRKLSSNVKVKINKYGDD